MKTPTTAFKRHALNSLVRQIGELEDKVEKTECAMDDLGEMYGRLHRAYARGLLLAGW